jgi:hypothetical protein
MTLFIVSRSRSDSFAEFAQDITRQVAGVLLSYMDAG